MTFDLPNDYVSVLPDVKNVKDKFTSKIIND
jgi:hypothetical protein